MPKNSMSKTDNSLAIIWKNEGEDSFLNSLTIKELREQVMYEIWFIIHREGNFDFI